MVGDLGELLAQPGSSTLRQRIERAAQRRQRVLDLVRDIGGKRLRPRRSAGAAPRSCPRSRAPARRSRRAARSSAAPRPRGRARAARAPRRGQAAQRQHDRARQVQREQHRDQQRERRPLMPSVPASRTSIVMSTALRVVSSVAPIEADRRGGVDHRACRRARRRSWICVRPCSRARRSSGQASTRRCSSGST